MRGRLESWLQARWYGGRQPGPVLRALSLLQAALARLNRRRARHAWQAPVPVVVVGNLTAGGTGKTPFVAWLAGELINRGYGVGIVSRGYGRHSHDTLAVEADSDWRQVGDEPLLLRRLTGCPVVVGRDRVAACRLLLAAAEPELILCDDGLQHYRLARDLEIAVIDGQRRFGNGRLMPAGPLREPLSRLGAVDFRVWNGGVPSGEEGIGMRLDAGRAINLLDGTSRDLKRFAPGPVRAVAGIGSPERFFASLEREGIGLLRETPGDHGAWVPGTDDDVPVLMTDKDAVKLEAEPRANWWRVPVEGNVEGATRLLDRIVRLLPSGTDPLTNAGK